MKTLAKWTVQDYHRLIEAGILGDRQVELLKGEIVEMAPEEPIHTYVTEGGTEYLRSLLQGKALVREAHPVTLSNSEPEPDVAILRLSRPRYRQRHPYPEDIFWLIEISQSTLSYDLNEKKKIYAQEGIREYWVVDLVGSKIYVFRQPNSEEYNLEFVVGKGTIVPEAFPDVEVSVKQFLGEVQ